MKNIWIVIAVIIVAVLVVWYALSTQQKATAPVDTTTETEESSDADSANQVTVQLNELNDSGESGTAVLSEVDGQTQVRIDLVGVPRDLVQPAHIHGGSCPGIGPIAYNLTSVTNGISQTTVDASIAELLEGEYAINVHLSAVEIGTYVACGDISN